MTDKEQLYILKGLLRHLDFTSRFIDKLKKDYFSPEIAPVVVIIKKFFLKTQRLPTIEMIIDIYLDKVCNGDSVLKDKSEEIINEALQIEFEQKDYNEYYDWLVDLTKEFIRNKSIESALVTSTDLFLKGKRHEAVQSIIEAANITFDEDLGVEYFADMDKRMDALKDKTLVIPTGITSLDDKIGGGIRPKSLVIFGAGTNVGKTLILSAITTNLIKKGYNGLYVTLEINDLLLSNRIDANIANISLGDIPNSVEQLKENIVNLNNELKMTGKSLGRLIVKEYPPASISAQSILSLVKELEMKKNGFKPDFICLDYIALMSPNGKSFSDNSYGRLKTVAEELRAVGVKLNVPILSAVQINRDGYDNDKNKEIGLQNTSDSMGIPMTADLMVLAFRTPELDKFNMMRFKIAKSRWSRNGDGINIKVDYNHMRIMDADDCDIGEELSDAQKQTINSLNSSNNIIAAFSQKDIKI